MGVGGILVKFQDKDGNDKPEFRSWSESDNINSLLYENQTSEPIINSSWDPLERNGKVPDQFGGVIVGIVGKHRTYSEWDQILSSK